MEIDNPENSTLPKRSESPPPSSNNEPSGDVEAPNLRHDDSASSNVDDEKSKKTVEDTHVVQSGPAVDPSKLSAPIRTDPLKALEARRRKLDRQTALKMPEIHYVGQIVNVSNVISESSEGKLLYETNVLVCE